MDGVKDACELARAVRLLRLGAGEQDLARQSPSFRQGAKRTVPPCGTVSKARSLTPLVRVAGVALPRVPLVPHLPWAAI